MMVQLTAINDETGDEFDIAICLTNLSHPNVNGTIENNNDGTCTIHTLDNTYVVKARFDFLLHLSNGFNVLAYTN